MMSSWFSDFFPPNVLVFVSERDVDFSLEKSCPLTSEQKKCLEFHTGFDCKNLFQISQQHGDVVVTAGPTELVEQRIRKADGVLTDRPRLPIAVRTADCLPIFIYDPVHKAIGIVHAGWKGSQKRIVVKALTAMKEKYDSQANELKIAFGPAIRPCCYEVGRDVQSCFPKEIKELDGRFFLDLPRVNLNQLMETGVKPSQIVDCKICTCCDSRFFSYRREGAHAGRMLALMMLKK